MKCPICEHSIEAEYGSTLDFATMVERAHAILHEPEQPFSSLGAVRRDIAGVLVALSIKLADLQAPGKAEP